MGLLNYKSGNQNISGYLLISPALVFMLVFAIIPIGASFVLSFFRWPIFANPEWNGFRNFVNIFGSQVEDGTRYATDPAFWQALGNNAFYLIQVPLQMVWALALAMLFNRRTRLTYLYRSLVFLPVISAMVAVAVVWRWIYQPTFGILNSFLQIFGIDGPDWLGDIHWAKPSVILLNLWRNGGYLMMIYLAALQGVPDSYYQAADMEGASAWQKFTRITFPIISPTHFFLLVMGVIWSFQMFPQIYVLTRGGPAGYTTSMVFYIYERAFEDFRMGYSSALAMILFVIVMAFTLIQWSLRKRWVYGEN